MKRVLTVILLYILSALPAFPRMFFGIDRFGSPTGFVLWVLPMLLFFAAAHWAARWAGMGGLGGLGLTWSRGAGRNLGLGALAGTLTVGATLAVAAAAGQLTVTAVHLDRVPGLILAPLVAFAWTAFSEEVVDRGALMRAMPGLKPIWLVAVTSLLFAAGHVPNYGWDSLNFLRLCLGGVVYVVATLGTGTLWFAIGAHWAYDVLNPLLLVNHLVLAGGWTNGVSHWSYVAGEALTLALLPLLLRPAARSGGTSTNESEAA